MIARRRLPAACGQRPGAIPRSRTCPGPGAGERGRAQRRAALERDAVSGGVLIDLLRVWGDT